MGAESDAYVTVDSSGNARAASGMCATVRDIARIGQLVLQEDDSVVPAEWIRDMVVNGSKEAFAAGEWACELGGLFSLAYRSGWMVDREEEVFVTVGIYGQMLLVDRKRQIVVAKTSSQPDPEWDKDRLTMAAFKDIRRILS